MDLLLLKLEQGLLFDSALQLLLNLFNPLFILFQHLLDLLDVIADGHLFPVDSILVGLVEIPLLAQEFPGRLGLVRDDRGLGKLGTHLDDLVLKTLILVVDVSYQADMVVVEGTFLL